MNHIENQPINLTPVPSEPIMESEEDLVRAAQDALLAIAAWKITDDQERYQEIGEALRKALMDAHDKLFSALQKEANKVIDAARQSPMTTEATP